jgi:hypothetical protein
MDESLRQRFCAQAEKLGIVIDHNSIQKHHSQGYISQVFTAISNVGEIVVHLVKLNPAQEHILVKEKTKPLSDALIQFGGIPTAKVYASFQVESYTIVISQFLPGSLAGKRKNSEADFSDDWHSPLTEIGDGLERIIFRIHSFQPERFGWIGSDAKRGGEFTNWLSFLVSEIAFWAEKIALGEKEIGKTEMRLADRFLSYFNSIKPEINYKGKPALVHGDTTNPSNILVDKGKITGIIDWEYALGADPAWEFAFKNENSLKTYFSLSRKRDPQFDEKAFLKRVYIYYPIICGIWCFVHSFSPGTPLYTVCRNHLDVTLASRGF